MNVVGTQVEAQTVNVLSLFGNLEMNPGTMVNDPLDALLRESMVPEGIFEEEKKEALKASPERLLVSENNYPEQSMYILEKQLKRLNESLGRIRFYLGDMDDLLPR